MTDRRTRRLTAENATTSRGEPILIDIIEDLTWGELKRLQNLPKPVKYDDIAKAINKYVVSWNVEGRNAETGELETLPAPADAGSDVFDCVEPWIIDWLYLCLRVVHVEDALPKKLKSLSAMRDGAPAPDSDSPPPASA